MFKIKECILHVIQTGKGWHKIVFCLSNYDTIKICSNQIKFLLNRSKKKINFQSKTQYATASSLPAAGAGVLRGWGLEQGVTSGCTSQWCVCSSDRNGRRLYIRPHRRESSSSPARVCRKRRKHSTTSNARSGVLQCDNCYKGFSKSKMVQ